jgi:hypothetical protein
MLTEWQELYLSQPVLASLLECPRNFPYAVEIDP